MAGELAGACCANCSKSPAKPFIIANELGADLKVSDALAIESADGAAATAYVNVLAVKEGRENDEAIQALVKALKSDEVKEYMEETYQGSVVPVF